MTLHLYQTNSIALHTNGDIDSIRFTRQRKDSLKKPVKEGLCLHQRKELERSGPDYQLPRSSLSRKIASTPETLSQGEGNEFSFSGKRHGLGVLKRYRASLP